MEQTTSIKKNPTFVKKKKNEYSGLCIYRNRVWKKPHLVNYLKNMSGISMSVVVHTLIPCWFPYINQLLK